MSEPIRVLQVLSGLDVGGAESRTMDVFRHIDSSFCHFDFLTLTQGTQFYEAEIERLGGTVIKMPSPRNVSIHKHINMLRQIIRDGKYDAVHAHTSYHSGLVMYAAYLEHVPIRITHARTSGTNHDDLKTRAFLQLGRLFISLFATDFIAVSKEAGEFLFGKKNFCVFPNAIDAQKYIHSEINTEMIRTEFCIPKNSIVIGQIGRFEKMKNHEFTVKWFHEFCSYHTDSFLVFIGKGNLRNHIEDLVSGLGLSKKVVFAGVRNDIDRLIHMFDVLILPSVYEGFPGVVLEAQAAGVPVVLSDTITAETDLGLGLIERCDISGSYQDWNNAVICSLKKEKKEQEQIIKAFDQSGFDLKNTIEKLMNLYSRNRQ